MLYVIIAICFVSHSTYILNDESGLISSIFILCTVNCVLNTDSMQTILLSTFYSPIKIVDVISSNGNINIVRSIGSGNTMKIRQKYGDAYAHPFNVDGGNGGKSGKRC